MKIFYTADFYDLGIAEKGKSFSPTMSEYLWFKLFDFYSQQTNFQIIKLEEVLATLTNENYYLASLAKSYKGKQIIKHGEIYEVTSDDLQDFLLKMNVEYSDAWGMFTPVVGFNEPIKSLISFNENSYCKINK